jgi:hypothetical protein
MACTPVFEFHLSHNEVLLMDGGKQEARTADRRTPVNAMKECLTFMHLTRQRLDLSNRRS